ncbi:MAG: cupin domain-containing protein [Anaerolineaceae bacterium]|nr:MAG: cupin domain-containing protein [Anaerolineaceae bacterium]
MKRPIIVQLSEIEGEYRDPPRRSRLLLSGHNVGARNASMGVNVTEVGSMIPDHKHEDCEELMYIISGHARLVIEDGQEVYEIGPDTAIYSPKGVTHRLENIGNTELKLVWVYSPPLPHHRAEPTSESE